MKKLILFFVLLGFISCETPEKTTPEEETLYRYLVLSRMMTNFTQRMELDLYYQIDDTDIYTINGVIPVRSVLEFKEYETTNKSSLIKFCISNVKSQYLDDDVDFLFEIGRKKEVAIGVYSIWDRSDIIRLNYEELKLNDTLYLEINDGIITKNYYK